IRSWLSISTDIGVTSGFIGMMLGLGDHTEAILTVTRAVGVLAAAAFIVRMIFATYRGVMHPVGGLGVSTLVLVILFPVVHPWYILWAIFPLAAWANRLFFRYAVMIYSAVMSFVVLPRGLGLPPGTILQIYLSAAVGFAVLVTIGGIALRLLSRRVLNLLIVSTTFDGHPFLRLDNVVKDYGDKRAVNGLSFHVHQGELLCLLGANGAGKTTTIEMCEGFITPTSGEISVLGFNPATHPDAVRERVGIMLQGGGGYNGIKVREMLQLAARYSANPHDPDWLIDILGLGGVAKNTYRRLSGGQQQRLALALAIIGRPNLVF